MALEVLAANGVAIMADAQDGYTPTPVISHAILTYNRGRTSGLADGIVITPSHTRRKTAASYNPPQAGRLVPMLRAGPERTANDFLKNRLVDVKRLGTANGYVPNLVPHDYAQSYISDLASIIDMEAIRVAGLRIGVDPLGGAAVKFWQPIAEKFGLNIAVTNTTVDPTFRFVPRDWDGQIRMDCSSPYPMSNCLVRKDEFDIAFANDTGCGPPWHDRHSAGD